jgi:hypothetical protein
MLSAMEVRIQVGTPRSQLYLSASQACRWSSDEN